MGGVQVLATVTLLLWLIVASQFVSRNETDALPAVAAFLCTLALCVSVIVS